MSLELAIKLARARSPLMRLGCQRMPRMAAVLYSKRLAFIGYNSARTSTLQARYADRPDRIATHAEIDALAKAIRHFSHINGHHRSSHAKVRLDGFRLSVARVLANGEVGHAKPCVGCAAALEAFGIKSVEWT